MNTVSKIAGLCIILISECFFIDFDDDITDIACFIDDIWPVDGIFGQFEVDLMIIRCELWEVNPFLTELLIEYWI